MLSETEWRRLAADHEAAGRDTDLASATARAVGFDDPRHDVADARYEALRRVFEACEDDLLDVVAPTLEGVAYQLKVFSERFHSAILDGPAMSGEDRPAGEFLRHIPTGMLAQAPPPHGQN